MEIKKLNFPLDLAENTFPPLAMALGYFDGVHRGHKQVIAEAKKQAIVKGLNSAVMTFDPHPSVVLGRSEQHVQYITPLSEKEKIMEREGIDYLFIVHFTHEFANLLPQEFVDQFIIGLNVRHVVAGYDFTYGRMGKGTMETLPFHSREKFTYSIVPKLTEGDEKVSSTRIRSLIKTGRMQELPALLGRFYTTTGVVIHGDKRGRTIGFPTANIHLNDDYMIPPAGVYTVRMMVKGTWFNGVCNVGYKPTFNKEAVSLSVEVHLFDFHQEIYDETVEIEWHCYLRKEQKFSGIDELVSQIEKDKERAIQYFENNSLTSQ
ncbi:bifunctional riboflavin kinase/FAD synthetase [Bacillus sp. BRMEA1]|uniref:bifunctional riboflavin kinase/FAD synthetase n=1 Tax=Neobacillus endophyticus TaxID=2738405 RepID=UPI0015673A26|nr:bifunctional riboflavin kinase/FAD synthetase [Neobacillus endophyticus]NRD78884.1 bifunctional riboflavin kinase/FAD synthetase [Neobacillus endophyticus]